MNRIDFTFHQLSLKLKRLKSEYSRLRTQDSSLCIYNLLTLFLLISLLSPTAAAQSISIGDPFENYNRLLQSDTTEVSKSSFLIRTQRLSALGCNSCRTSVKETGDRRQDYRETLAGPPRQLTARTLPGFHDSRLTTQDSRLSPTHPWANHPHFTKKSNSSPFTLYVPYWTTTYNSEFAHGWNDGAMWQGRGINHKYSIGGLLKYGPMEISWRPEFGYVQNEDFDLAPDSPFFSYPYDLNEFAEGLVRIDMPQRFGDESYTWFHPGQSWIRLSQWGAAGGVSTANMWIGPARHNPLTMSNNAPGFFHAFLETDGPVTTPIGNVEARMGWGGLRESDYFDDDPSNNLRYITGLTATYSPSFVEGLHLGFSRIFYENYPESGLSSGHLFRAFQPYTEDRFAIEHSVDFVNREDPITYTANIAERMFSLFGRWVFPENGFEAWFEWGRADNSFDRRNLFIEPVHTRSYTLGFLKRFDLADKKWLTVDFELTQLENLENVTSENHPVWYESLVVKQGFTNAGQVLGAAIGPGSNSQRLEVKYYDRRGYAGLSGARIINNNDRLFRHFRHIQRNQPRIGPRPHWTDQVPQRPNIWDLHDTEYRIGGHLLLFLPRNFELQADLHVSLFYNRHNIYENDERNLNMAFTLRYHLPGFVR